MRTRGRQAQHSVCRRQRGNVEHGFDGLILAEPFLAQCFQLTAFTELPDVHTETLAQRGSVLRFREGEADICVRQVFVQPGDALILIAYEESSRLWPDHCVDLARLQRIDHIRGRVEVDDLRRGKPLCCQAVVDRARYDADPLSRELVNASISALGYDGTCRGQIR